MNIQVVQKGIIVKAILSNYGVEIEHPGVSIFGKFQIESKQQQPISEQNQYNLRKTPQIVSELG